MSEDQIQNIILETIARRCGESWESAAEYVCPAIEREGRSLTQDDENEEA